MEANPFNHVLNHITLHVPDIDAAIAFYTSILGFRKLQKLPRCTDCSTDPDAPIFRIYDCRLHKVKVAFLATGNSVGFELFQFIDPPMRVPSSFGYTRGGVFHFAVTDPEALCARVVAAGGREIGETVSPASADGEEVKTVALYVLGPWGNTIEACSCSFEKMMANRD